MEIDIKIAQLPTSVEAIQISSYSVSAKGVPASPERLYKIVHAALEAGICCFVFRKKSDGSLRRATGTRKYDIMPVTPHDPNAAPYKPKETNETKTAYWDYDSNSFKSFQNDSVVAVLVF